MTMTVTIKDYQQINKFLSDNGIDTILYGSLGVSVYLGNFRDFDDIDLLVDNIYMEEKWGTLKDLMLKNGFQITDEKEHEFINVREVKVAFAEKDVLIEDHICDPLTDTVTIYLDGVTVKTLKPECFIKAYTFSSTDGYRIEKRGDSDLNIVKKLQKKLRVTKVD